MVMNEPVSGSEIMILTSELPSGFYYVQVVTWDKKMYSGNFVVQ